MNKLTVLALSLVNSFSVRENVLANETQDLSEAITNIQESSPDEYIEIKKSDLIRILTEIYKIEKLKKFNYNPQEISIDKTLELIKMNPDTNIHLLHVGSSVVGTQGRG